MAQFFLWNIDDNKMFANVNVTLSIFVRMYFSAFILSCGIQAQYLGNTLRETTKGILFCVV